VDSLTDLRHTLHITLSASMLSALGSDSRKANLSGSVLRTDLSECAMEEAATEAVSSSSSSAGPNVILRRLQRIV
jgi:hypothetical protein